MDPLPLLDRIEAARTRGDGVRLWTGSAHYVGQVARIHAVAVGECGTRWVVTLYRPGESTAQSFVDIDLATVKELST